MLRDGSMLGIPWVQPARMGSQARGQERGQGLERGSPREHVGPPSLVTG